MTAPAEPSVLNVARRKRRKKVLRAGLPCFFEREEQLIYSFLGADGERSDRIFHEGRFHGASIE